MIDAVPLALQSPLQVLEPVYRLAVFLNVGIDGIAGDFGRLTGFF